MFDFSIVIPTKNEERNIVNCLKSIFNQRQKNIEIIIVDSSSKDKTIPIIKKYFTDKERKDIKLTLTNKNMPAEKAIAYGIHKSRGKIISFLGADDRLYNDQTLFNINKMFKNISNEILYGSYEIIDDDEKTIKKVISKKFDRDHLLNKENYICATSLFFKKSIFLKIGKSIDDGYDFAFILKSSKNLRFFRTKKILSKFKIHQMSNSGNFYKNLINIEKDYLISKKYGGKIFNTYHLRYLIIKTLSFFRLIWLAELKRKISMTNLLKRKIDFKSKSNEVRERIKQKI